jgi:hypothetical protein
MPLIYIVIALLAMVVIVSVLFSKYKGKPNIAKAELNEETEGLIFDHETGQYVTVEELVNKHQLDVIDDERIRSVYEALPTEMKQEVSLKEVGAILESHYQFKSLEHDQEAEKPEIEYIYQVIFDGFQRKGKTISKTIISSVIATYESKNSFSK